MRLLLAIAFALVITSAAQAQCEQRTTKTSTCAVCAGLGNCQERMTGVWLDGYYVPLDTITSSSWARATLERSLGRECAKGT